MINPEELAKLLLAAQSVSDESRKAAEVELEKAGRLPGFGTALLNIAVTAPDKGLSQMAAITLKNWCNAVWRGDGPESMQIGETERQPVRQAIIEAMLRVPSSARPLLSAALGIVAYEDFPERWPNLLQELASQIKLEKIEQTSNVLEALNTICERYRSQVKTRAIVEELKFVLDALVGKKIGESNDVGIYSNQPLREISSSLFGMIVNQSSQISMKHVLDSLTSITNIFYSLNFKDLPEVFEDTLEYWMDFFLNILRLKPSPTWENCDGLLDELKSSVIESLNMFLDKDEEELHKYVKSIMTVVWEQLTSTDGPLSPVLGKAGIKFMTILAKSIHTDLFASPEVLSAVVHRVVLPQVMINEEDMELIELNPIEWMRQDLMGGDTETKRRVAADLLQALGIKHGALLTPLLQELVQSLLADLKWQAKDAALFLASAAAAKGVTIAYGATSSTGLVDLESFFRAQVVPELEGTSSTTSPLVKAAAIKFILVYRSLIDKSSLLNLLPGICSLLGAEDYLVHSYAAFLIERLLALKEIPQSNGVNNSYRISAEDFQSKIEPPLLLEALLQVIFQDQAEHGENEFAMKAIMRVISKFPESIRPKSNDIMMKFLLLVEEIAKNPKVPAFNHWLFESFTALVRVTSNVEEGARLMEKQLLPCTQTILQNNVDDLIPYSLQLLATLLQIRPMPIPGDYKDMFSLFLSPFFWEKNHLIPALSTLLRSYIYKIPQDVVNSQSLTQILGVFQKLVGRRASEGESLIILRALFENVSFSIFGELLTPLWQILFTKLQSNPSNPFLKGFILAFSAAVLANGPVAVAASIGKLQSGLFEQVSQHIIASKASTVLHAEADRSLCAAALTNILFQYPPLMQDSQAQAWTGVLMASMDLIDHEKTVQSKISFDEEDPLVDSGFNKLQSAVVGEKDFLQGKSARKVLAMALQESGGHVKLIQVLPPDAQYRIAALISQS